MITFFRWNPNGKFIGEGLLFRLRLWTIHRSIGWQEVCVCMVNCDVFVWKALLYIWSLPNSDFNDTTEAALTYCDMLRHFLYHFYFHSSDHIHCMEFYELIQRNCGQIPHLLLLYMEYFVQNVLLLHNQSPNSKTDFGRVVLTFYTKMSTLVLQIKTSIKLLQGL